MAQFIVTGGKKLHGTFHVLGAKNAALKMIAASIMIPGKVTLHNVPNILDVLRMIEVINSLGAKTTFSDNSLTIDSTEVKSFSPDENPVKKLRGSVVVIGPLLSKFSKAHFSEPGGCLIGSRPIDTHLKAFRAMGVDIEISDNGEKFFLKGTNEYKSGKLDVTLAEMSVTATENVMMAAVLRKGKTTIRVCASEPEIVDLANFLNLAGAKISGAGTNVIEIEGVNELSPTEYKVMPDRIEAGTMIIAAAITGGRVVIEDVIPEHMSLFLSKMSEMNLEFEIVKNKDRTDIIVEQKSKLTAPVSSWLDVRPYPGLPTDLQSPLAVLATQAQGETKIFETMFGSRFDYVKWLIEMGAKIDIVNPYMIEINGPTRLHSQTIESSDLRGGAALLIAALCANGQTTIDKIEYIDRGYENFDLRLRSIGAEIERKN